MVRRIVFSSSVGNALEWFDFLIYGYFAKIIAQVFFPGIIDQEKRHILFE